LQFMVKAAGALLAGHRPCVGVDAELQAFRVNVVRESFHAARKSDRISYDVAGRIAAHLPTVVDVDVLISGFLHAGCDHRIGDLFDQLLADVAGELIPTVPAHRRRPREAVAHSKGVGLSARQ
jgi:hypothetical protein